MGNYGERLDNIISLDLQLQGLINSKLKNIDEFNASWSDLEMEGAEEFLRELKELSTIQSIGSSTRIEGSKLQDSEIRDLIKDLDINKLQSRDEEEVTGYYEALDLIYESYETLFLSESYIKQLHGVLLKHSSKDTRHCGQYKALSNKVVAKYPDGKSRIVFNTTEPYLTAKEMAELIDWANERLSYTGVHPLLVIAAFVYEFLSIHPFQDGNGRLSRLLTNLLMMKSGYKFVQYISFEHVIEQRKKEYYQNLMEAQANRFTEEENLGLWFIYFFDCIENLISKLQAKVVDAGGVCDKSQLEEGLSQRQSLILDFVNKNGQVKIADLEQEFPDLNREAIKYTIYQLLEAGKLSRHGQGRGTWYQAR
ncbi:MAG: Fic family protein [Candidatus Melainabacteria bacterium]|nr:Fic family protein [Candidatus Melainabacteria bacterium]